MRRATTEGIPGAVLVKISIHALLAESDIISPHSTPDNRNFYPRSPCGERPLAVLGIHTVKVGDFYPRSPCGERHRSIVCIEGYVKKFLSTLSLRRATAKVGMTAAPGKNDFYPRSPCGERRESQPPLRTCPTHNISIHALLAESDLDGAPPLTYRANFYPRSPCGERQQIENTLSKVINHFYPRSPCGERPMMPLMGAILILFLSTLSLRRATREPTALRTPHHKFLSTLSLRRATNCTSIGRPKRLYFYPRSPCGERLSEKSESSATYLQFDPRSPCGERLKHLLIIYMIHRISIHALLAESDVIREPAASREQQISIHALLAESDSRPRALKSRRCVFLSTLSLRRATPIFLSTLSLRRATIYNRDTVL